MLSVLLLLSPLTHAECGTASWYGSRHAGRATASGERFNPNALTAAHKHYRFGTKLKVSYKGRSVVVKISDRGPYIKGRIIDLSAAAARAIGMQGIGHVCLTKQ